MEESKPLGSEMAPLSLIGSKGSAPSKKWICSTMSGHFEAIQRWKGRKPVFKDPQVSNRLQSLMGLEVGPSWRGRVGKPLLIVMGIGGRVLWHCESMWLCTTMKQTIGWRAWGLVVAREGLSGVVTGVGGDAVGGIVGLCRMGGSVDG